MLIIYFIMFLIFVLLMYNYLENQLMPTLISIAELKIRTLSANIICDAVDETLIELNISSESMVTYYYNEEGNIVSIGINSVLINFLSSGIIKKITDKIEDYDQDIIKIPIGRLLGRSVFSNIGPNISLKILPYGTINVNYDSSFTSTGINQINHRIWLNVDMIMEVIVPANTTHVKIKQEIILIDRVIEGDVPNQYIVIN